MIQIALCYSFQCKISFYPRAHQALPQFPYHPSMAGMAGMAGLFYPDALSAGGKYFTDV